MCELVLGFPRAAVYHHKITDHDGELVVKQQGLIQKRKTYQTAQGRNMDRKKKTEGKGRQADRLINRKKQTDVDQRDR